MSEYGMIHICLLYTSKQDKVTYGTAYLHRMHQLSGVKICIIPVSYTHLDVYKRQGVYITPAFPKLIYVLEDDNITEDSKYWNLTVLAAQCSATRMVPDYISEKVMKELKDGDVYTCLLYTSRCV